MRALVGADHRAARSPRVAADEFSLTAFGAQQTGRGLQAGDDLGNNSLAPIDRQNHRFQRGDAAGEEGRARDTERSTKHKRRRHTEAMPKRAAENAAEWSDPHERRRVKA